MRLRLLLCILPLLLAGCEYDSAAYSIDGQNHSVALVREQRWVWKDEVEQFLVPSRIPECQRRHPITAGTRAGPEMELYEVQPMLYIAHQGEHWWAVGTEQCLVQDWAPQDPVPGRLIGRFERRDGDLVFSPAEPTQPLR